MERKDLRIIFMGTPEFAVPSLEILCENGYKVVAVITTTDKKGGRGGKQLLESAVKKYAVSRDIPVLQPPNLKSPSFVEELRSYNADLQVVVAFRMLPEVVWNMPPMGTINLHGSLLPAYRGAAPINWAVINGEKETGVTTFRLKHAIDTGDIILQKRMDIGLQDTAGDVHDRMMHIGAEAVLETVNLIAEDQVTYSVQDEKKVSKAPKLYHEDGQIDWESDGKRIFNLIRGLSPYPAAWTYINGKETKIYKADFHPASHNVLPGKLVTDQKRYLHIFARKGFLEIKELKMEGKRKMKINEFLNGTTIDTL